jgi:signal transduction histidine kinase
MQTDLDSLRNVLVRSYVSIVVIFIAFLQVITYFSTFQIRYGYIDVFDAIIEFSLAAVAFLLILIFQRSIDKSSARIPLQFGWVLIFIVVFHTGLIQIVDLFYPYSDTILAVIIQSIQDSITPILGLGAILLFVGIYNWIADIGFRESRFYSIVAAMPIGIAVTDLRGRVTLYNDRLTKILHLHEGPVTNTRLSELLRTDVTSMLVQHYSELDRPFEIDLIYGEDEDRKYLTISWVGNFDKERKLTGHIVVVTDVTQRRRSEEEREQQRRVIDLYASLLSHDIGNDLQAVLGYIEAAQMLIDEDLDRAMKMLNTAEAAGVRMSNLIRTFRVEQTPSHISIVRMIREVSEQAEKATLGMNVSLNADADTEGLRSAGGFLLPIAIDNILRNAAQHAGENPEVTINVLRADDDLIIRISDDGPGIPEDKLAKVFSRGSLSSDGGLGLYLTKQIIIACGGSITLDETSPGAAFRIILPVIE